MPKLPVKNQTALGKKLQGKAVYGPNNPLWLGPESNHPILGGISYSNLCRWIVCRKRARIAFINGLMPVQSFNSYIDYGSMWHAAEEALAGGKNWRGAIADFARGLAMKYPTDRQQIEHWTNVCMAQFPHYIGFFKQPKKGPQQVSVFEERVFSVPLTLPSGRVVYLRGKWDRVFLLKEGKKKTVWLQENKTKSAPDEQEIRRQLKFDLQTMIYLVALREVKENDTNFSDLEGMPIDGILYNVVRRPLSGGKGSIVRHKGTKNKAEESYEEFYQRLGGVFAEDPASFFMRWDVGITDEDVEVFLNDCLYPMLENVCWWHDTITSREGKLWVPPPVEWRHPFGVYNSIDERGASEYDAYLETGNMAGLSIAKTLYPELEAA